MCWEMGLENTMAQIIGNLGVPYIIRWLGSEDISYGGRPDLVAARALGTAQALIICIPNLICFAVYSGLLWSFPLDLKRVQEETERDNTELAPSRERSPLRKSVLNTESDSISTAVGSVFSTQPASSGHLTAFFCRHYIRLSDNLHYVR